MEDLAFPVLDAAPPRAEVAVQKPAAPDGIDLRKIDLADVALAQFGPWRDDVAAVTANLSTLALDLSTQTMVDAAKSLRFRLIGQPRADLRKVSKGIKSKLAQVSKTVGTEEEAAVAAYDKAEELITPQIEAREAQLAAEKAERDRIEAERVAAHNVKIDQIRAFLARCEAPDMTSERIGVGIAMLEKLTFPKEVWEEFAIKAANAQCETLEAMRKLQAAALGREKEAARQAEIRAENERQAEANRLERERIAAELEKIRQAAAALEVQQAQIRADNERAEAADRKAAEEKAQAEAEAAEDQRQAEAIEAAKQSAMATTPAGAVVLTYDAQTQQVAASVMHAIDSAQRITEGQAPQQVLKAEGESPDATDRDAPANASPRVGAMGEGQPADAGPVTETAAEPSNNEPDVVLAALTCERLGAVITGFLTPAQFNQIKAIFLTATTQGPK